MIRVTNYQYIRNEAVSSSLQNLLNNKHLYQSETITSKALAFKETYGNGKPTEQAISEVELAKKYFFMPWNFICDTNNEKPNNDDIVIPNIETYCHLCKTRTAFKAISSVESSLHIPAQSEKRQVHLLSFMCQKCSITNVDFAITRSGMKLTLVGRSPIETIEAPPFIPKALRKYYSEAVIDRNAGATLQGLFMLRTLLEQYWKSLNLRPNPSRPTGDELGDAYNESLPDDFKQRFPSLREIYAELSKAMHNAQSDNTLFDNSRSKIDEHFDAKRLFKI